MSLYSVNGKEPIAAWIPSLDIAGNGTTTLTDLVGSNHGTLTNMDPATDWVVDGGKTALDLDGVNDVVVTSQSVANFTGLQPFTLSTWVKKTTSVRADRLLSKYRASTGDGQYIFGFQPSGLLQLYIVQGNYSTARIHRQASSALTANEWHHCVCTYNGGTSQAAISLYVDGSEIAYGTNDSSGSFSGMSSSTAPLAIGATNASNDTTFIQNLLGRKDDSRIFDQALNATDVSDLYAAGRGGDASGESTGNPTANLLNSNRFVRHAL